MMFSKTRFIRQKKVTRYNSFALVHCRDQAEVKSGVHDGHAGNFPPEKGCHEEGYFATFSKRIGTYFLWGTTSIIVQLTSNLTGLNLVPFLMLKLRALSFLVEFNQSDGIYRALIVYRNLLVSS